MSSPAPSPWPEVRLGDILTYLDQRIELENATEYVTITVKRRHGGLEPREHLLGHQIMSRKQFRVIPGAFIISRVQCWHEAYAIVPNDVPPNMIASANYDQFAISPKVDSRFFWWLSHSPQFRDTVRNSAFGVVIEKMVFDREAWLEKTISLPPLPEQERIVPRIDGLMARINEASDLRSEIVKKGGSLFASSLDAACVGKITDAWRKKHPNIEPAKELIRRISKTSLPEKVAARKRTPLPLPLPPPVPSAWAVVEAGELQEKGLIFDIQDGNHGSEYPRKSEFSDEGVPFVTAKQIKAGTVAIGDAPRLPQERAERLRIGFARAGDVLLTHNASVGDVAVAPPSSGRFLIGTSVTYWRCNSDALEPQYLYYFMVSRYFQQQLRSIMKQTTRNQVSVLKQVNLWICIPPILEQRRIVEYLDGLNAKLNEFATCHNESTKALDALTSSILDKAFRGEL